MTIQLDHALPAASPSSPATAANQSSPATAADLEAWEFNVAIVESGPEANRLIKPTDDGCGSTCQSACSNTCK